MRRAPIVLTTTVAGMAAVLSFKAREPELPTASASAGTAATTTTPAPAPSTSSGGSRTATGDAISTRYGNAQVRVTVSNGKITKIEALQLQGNDPKSVQISGSAEPLLRQSALTKQSAAIDAVSGATITSASYEASLQSALDKAGFTSPDGSKASTDLSSADANLFGH
jgi:uncharacterized protein with FMN-binding domain